MVRWLLIAVVVSASGCKKEDPRYEGPMPIAFGDCAGPTVAWVSGPRPQPFTLEQAEGVWTVATAAVTPPKGDPDEGGEQRKPADAAVARMDKIATAGKHGAIPPDLQRVRQQAIDQARAAGILGEAPVEQTGALASLTGTADFGGADDTNIYGALLEGQAGAPGGGFGYGRSGFGPAGGGTGWGTVGTGRYGTIGHGSGTGAGYGVGGGRGGSSSVPTVSTGELNIQGDLDLAIIRRYLRRNVQRIQYCYERALLVHPKLAGTVATQFFIAPSGQVASSTASGVNEDVASCVAEVIKRIEFPRPRGGGGVQVSCPFAFRAGDDGATPSEPAKLTKLSGSDAPDRADPLASAGSATSAAGAGGNANGVGGTAPGAGSAERKTRELFRAADRGPVDASKYEPGANNPLRAEQAALVECFRKNPQHHGGVIIELHFDATGNVGDAMTYGLEDERTRSCLIATAKLHKRTGAGPAAQRCAIAFGVMPPAKLPAIDITTDAVKLDGKQLATLEALTRGDQGAHKILDLVTAIEARVNAAAAATGPALVIHDPLLVRPTPTAPMSVVMRVATSVLAAGDDFVLAAQRGPDWQILQTMMALPVVPVPFGTGGRWNHIKSKRRSPLVDDERVTLSLLVTKERVWVGLSRVQEFQEVARDASQLEKLGDVLKAHRASAFFADRADYEIAAEGDVTYEDVVNVIETASKAGFVAWLLTDPSGLAARPTL